MDSEPIVPDQSTPATPAGAGRAAPGVNLFFRMAAGLVLLFVITIFALIAILFGDPAAPIAKLLDRYGMQLIIVEMCAILITGALAMTVDRWQVLRASQPTQPASRG
ncbi:MAG: hypothetical protein V4719_11670 [Planctomycetota bacterium]